VPGFAPSQNVSSTPAIAAFGAPCGLAQSRINRSCTASGFGVTLPGVPAIAETLPGYEASIFNGIVAPAGTPRPVLEKLNAEVNKILASPEVRETWGKQGAQPMGMSIDAFDKFLRADIAKWAKVVKVAGAKAD